MGKDNGNGKAAEPQFDFSHIGHKKARELQKLFTQIQAANRKINEGPIADVDEAVEALDELLNRQDEYIASVLVDVPRDWLVVDAPSQIRWDQVDSLQWLRADKFQPLAKAMQDKQRGN